MDKQDRYADHKMGGYVARQMQLGQEEHGRDHVDAEEDGYIVPLVQLGTEPTKDQSDTEDLLLDPNVNA